MDRRVGNSDPNLVCPECFGRALFDLKPFRRIPELVVDDPSHANLQRLSAGRQITPVRFDKIRKTSTSPAAETCAAPAQQITSVRRRLPCHCCHDSGHWSLRSSNLV